MGNLKSFTDPNSNTYTWSYDVLSRTTGAFYPDGSKEQWSYDTAGNLHTFTNTAGVLKQSTFDSRNRLIESKWLSNDSLGDDVTFGYDAVGNVLRIANSNSVITYKYDGANQRISETQAPAGGTPQTIQYSYNADGLGSTVAIPGSYTLGFAYDGRNLVSGIEDGSGHPYVTYSYAAASNRLSRALANATSTTYAYDTDERLAKQTELSGQTTLRV
jgi:YD repeat-containing protein